MYLLNWKILLTKELSVFISFKHEKKRIKTKNQTDQFKKPLWEITLHRDHQILTFIYKLNIE